jgi:voltage-gated potassium channel
MSIVRQPSLESSDLTWGRAKTWFPGLLDRFLARPMFWLAVAFLAVSAGVIHRIGHGHTTLFEAEVIVWGLVVLWPIFVLDGLLRLVICRRPATPHWHNIMYFLLVCLAPPFRLGAPGYADSERIWLPWVGWNRPDRALQKRLERLFSVPMLVIALMVLPLLAMEYFWLETVRANFLLSLALDVGTGLIWMAFAIEFVVMVSVCHGKLRYCLQHWMDLAVVALPLIDFLPILRLIRLTRVLELQQITRLGRLYRLRGLLLKTWRAALLLEMIQRLLGDYKKKRLQRLQDLLVVRNEEIVELRKEIAALECELRGRCLQGGGLVDQEKQGGSFSEF